VDDVVPLTIRTIHTQLSTDASKSDLPNQICNWSVTLSHKELREAQENDRELNQLLKWKTGNGPSEFELSLSSAAVKHWWNSRDLLRIIKGVLYYIWINDDKSETALLLVPKTLRGRVLSGCHDSKCASHHGEEKTLQRVRSKYIWYGVSQDCKAYVRTCKECSTSKKPHIQPKALLGQFHAGIPMERIHIDILGPFVESTKGNRYIVMMIDQFTKWLECYAIPNQGAEQVAMSLVEGFIARMGCPLQIHSDQGKNFMSDLFRKLCQLLEISKTRTTLYRPCANGQIERYNRTILQAIRCYFKNARFQRHWDRHLQLIADAIRATVNRQTGFTANKMM
jgi:transposase InsO family protein